MSDEEIPHPAPSFRLKIKQGTVGNLSDNAHSIMGVFPVNILIATRVTVCIIKDERLCWSQWRMQGMISCY
jgi:hypothetical protein